MFVIAIYIRMEFSNDLITMNAVSAKYPNSTSGKQSVIPCDAAAVTSEECVFASRSVLGLISRRFRRVLFLRTKWKPDLSL